MDEVVPALLLVALPLGLGAAAAWLARRLLRGALGDGLGTAVTAVAGLLAAYAGFVLWTELYWVDFVVPGGG